jgi:capsular exopolysaccharide synthesis family protein
MAKTHNVHIQEENELRKIFEQISKHYLLFVFGVVIALGIAFVINYFSIPSYKVTSSVLIIENKQKQSMGDYINNSLFGTNENLQNELLMLKSDPLLKQTIINLDLPVNYYTKKDFRYFDAYKNVPFKVLYLKDHVQPLRTKFCITFNSEGSFQLKAVGEKTLFYNFEKEQIAYNKANWSFECSGKVGKLIESKDLSFIIELDSLKKDLIRTNSTYYFELFDVPSLVEYYKSSIEFKIVDLEATAIEVSMKVSSPEKGVDILQSITDVYSKANLEKKNHLAEITIDYIDKQLGEISDSLSQSELALQKFRTSNQLLNVTEQSSGITAQYQNLENQKAEIINRKLYYQSVSEYLFQNSDYSNMIVPGALGIQDPLLTNLIGQLISAQTEKNNLVENNQEKNPLVKRLNIQIDNLKRSITENISNDLKTTEIALDEINKRISKIEGQISRMPKTELELTGIERTYRLNESINNYLMEKRAEAKITKASNLPDNEIIEPAKVVGLSPVSPNKRMNYIIAFLLGLIFPFSFLQLKSIFNNKIESQEQIEKITDVPVLGKILHNYKKETNVVFEHPNSSISEAYRALRTNLEYYVRGGHKRVILVTSSIEGEGKSFNALNLAMCYAQFNRKVLLIDFDLRKPNAYFNKKGEGLVGLSSFLINKAVLEDIIIHSPHEKLDYIPSGPIPPNPVELIGLERTEKMIQELKERYDYIIIDTPPLAQVTDGYLLMEQADVRIIVARYNYTMKNVFSFVVKDLHQKGIGNLCIVLNDNRYFRDQYGYGYGYNKK